LVPICDFFGVAAVIAGDFSIIDSYGDQRERERLADCEIATSILIDDNLNIALNLLPNGSSKRSIL
jgi:hypothetical protein